MKVKIKNEELQLRFKNSGLSQYKLNRFMDLILRRYIFSKMELAEIPSKMFIKIDKDYKLYLNWLVDNDIVYVNNHYEVGKFYKSYGLTDNFKLYEYELEFAILPKKHKPSNKNIVDSYIKRKLANDYRSIKVIGRPELRFDNQYPLFKRWIMDCYGLSFVGKGSYHWTNNRLYNPFVMLSSKSRLDCISLNDLRLGNKDIRGSFPLFLSKYLKDNNNETDDSGTTYEINEFCDDVINGDFYEMLRLEYNKQIPLFKKPTTTTQENNQDGSIKYAKEEPYYDHIGGKLVEIKHYSRTQMKIIFQMILNGDWRKNSGDVKKNKTIYSFYMKYPLIFDILQQENLYSKLEAMESDWLFNVVVKRLYDDIPDIKILTCHDQIYYPFDNEDDVSRIWTEEYEKLITSYHKLNDYTPLVDLKDNYDYMGIEKVSYIDLQSTNKEKERLLKEKERRKKELELDNLYDYLTNFI